MMLPPNMTSHLQPLDAGIIRSFKSNYRKLIAFKFIRQVEFGDTPSVDIKEAIKFTHESWDSVTQTTIQNCWRHTGIVSSEIISTQSDCNNSSLEDILKSIPGCCYQSATEYINCDVHLETGEIINEDDIIEILEDSDSVSSQKSEEENSLICDKDAIAAILTTIQYIEQPNNFDLNDDIKLKDDLVTLLTRFKRRVEVIKLKRTNN